MDQKKHLFRVAASRPSWMVAHCAAVLAATTTCRSVELKYLRWKNIDLFSKVIAVNRSKTAAGRREIPLMDDAIVALAHLRERVEAEGTVNPDTTCSRHASMATWTPPSRRKRGARLGVP